MNNLGYSKDNVFIGDVRVKGQDETLIIGNENGGPGYILPEEKGTEGQVITMNADNTTSFQDAGGIDGRVVKNLYTMIDRNASFSGTPQDVYSTGYGSLDLGSIDNFPVGATIHLYTKGTWQTSGGLVPANFSLIINDGEPTSVSFDGAVLSMTNNNQRYFYTDLILQRTATNEYKFKGTGLTSAGGSGDPGTAIFYPASTFSPTTPFTSLDLRFTWTTTNSNFYPLTTTFIVDMILDSSLLITSPPAPTSHTALTDLTAADAGHTQFALLQGRTGGQILSGGITPAHFLTLKSHTAGLDNMIIRDLNTEFKKHIDMNQNQIDNVLVVNNQTGPLNLIGGSNVSAVLIDPSPTQGIIIGTDVGTSAEITGDTTLDLRCNTGNIECYPFNQFNVNAGGLPRLSVDATQVSIANDVDMNNNDIKNVTRIEGNTGQDMVLYSDDGITIAARDPMIINALDGDGIICQTSSNTRMVVTSTELDVRVPINMNNNIISDTPTVSSSTSLQLTGSSADEITINPNPTTGVSVFSDTGKSINLVADGGNQSMTLDGTFVTFFQGGGSFVPSFSASDFDMNNGGINNVGSINNYSVIGGLSCGTSNSALLTASTTETSILPLTFIGSRQVPANAFQQGDSFSATLAGSFGSANGDDVTIRLKGGATGTTILSSVIVPLNASSASSFELDIQFSIRQTGAAGVAELVTNYAFTYNQSGGGGAFVGERNCEINTTTFDTTILNQLDITAQFSSTNANNSIQTFLSNLHKIY